MESNCQSPPSDLVAKQFSKMDNGDGFDDLRGLYQDLSALSRSALPNAERLLLELEETLTDFRKLLDKQSKNNNSRQAVLSGRILRLLL